MVGKSDELDDDVIRDPQAANGPLMIYARAASHFLFPNSCDFAIVAACWKRPFQLEMHLSKSFLLIQIEGTKCPDYTHPKKPKITSNSKFHTFVNIDINVLQTCISILTHLMDYASKSLNQNNILKFLRTNASIPFESVEGLLCFRNPANYSTNRAKLQFK